MGDIVKFRKVPVRERKPRRLYRRTVYKVVCPESRKRIALQCVDLLLPGATPRQRKRIASTILRLCDGKDRRVRITAHQARELILPHMQCIAKNGPELVFWEPIARSLNIYFNEEE